MLPISARDTIRFTPPSLEGQDGAPVYLLAVPTLRSRAAFRRELQAEGVVYHDDDQAFQALRDAVSRQVDPDTNVELQRVFDRYLAARREAGEVAESAPDASQAPVSPEQVEQAQEIERLGRQIAELEQQMLRADVRFARLIAERAHYLQMAPLLAAQMFLMGWENVPHRFERRGDRATDECLMRVPEDHLVLCGWRVMSLFRPGEAQAKN